MRTCHASSTGNIFASGFPWTIVHYTLHLFVFQYGPEESERGQLTVNYTGILLFYNHVVLFVDYKKLGLFKYTKLFIKRAEIAF